MKTGKVEHCYHGNGKYKNLQSLQIAKGTTSQSDLNVC